MKYCTNCATQCEEDAAFCDHCGTPFAPAQAPSVAAQAPSQSMPEDNEHYKFLLAQQKMKYSGMSGWLVFFALISIFNILYTLSNVQNLFNVIEQLGNSGSYSAYYPDGYKAALGWSVFAYILSYIAVVFEILFVLALFGKKPSFLRRFQITRIIGAASVVFLYLVPGLITDSLTPETLLFVLSSITGIFLMSYYYCKSVRVRTYMGSDEYIKKALFRY
ncbi:MAG: hypothetical protein LBM28_04005 [Oscillospiraceae bacterium]|nr:hypothetical protein [Oscillospiraceae bacterium]